LPPTPGCGAAFRDALHFAALFDRFIQNLRRYTGHDLQYFAAIEPSAGSPRTSTSPCAAPSPAPNSARSSPPPTHPGTITRRFKKLAAAAGLPEIDLHDVRH